MTDLDLTEAVDAAARRWLAEASDGSWDKAAPIAKNRIREAVLPLVEAAAPVIAAQVAEQIARSIEADLIEPTENCPLDEFERAKNIGTHDAARIARDYRTARRPEPRLPDPGREQGR